MNEKGLTFEQYLCIFKRLDEMRENQRNIESKLNILIEQKAPKDRSNKEKAITDEWKVINNERR